MIIEPKGGRLLNFASRFEANSSGVAVAQLNQPRYRGQCT